jgi:hypothetical protein
MIGQRFKVACRKSGIPNGRNQGDLDCSIFQRPGQGQMTLGF